MSDPRRQCTSASNAEADSLCPGRFQAQLGLAQETSDDAAFGQGLHKALATGQADELTLEQLDLYESCEKIVQWVGQRVFGTRWDMAKGRPFSEERYWIKLGGYDHSGQCDRVYRYASRALILEFKSLAGKVASSPRNMQLRDEAVLVRQHFFVDQVGCAVIQPLVTHKPEICLYETDDLDQAEAEMAQRIVNSHAKDAPRIAGELQCTFCRAKRQCASYQSWITRDMPVPRSIVDVPIASWSPEQCALFLSQRTLASKWLDDAYDSIKARLKAGEKIPGWGLSEGQLRSYINDPQQLYQRFETLGGTQKQFMGCVKIGMEKLEAALNQVTGKKGKALAELMKEILRGIATEKRTDSSVERKDE